MNGTEVLVNDSIVVDEFGSEYIDRVSDIDSVDKIGIFTEDDPDSDGVKRIYVAVVDSWSPDLQSRITMIESDLLDTYDDISHNPAFRLTTRENIG